MKKKLTAIFLILALAATMTSQAFAVNVSSDSVESCTVTLTQKSDFTVTVPKYITLDGQDGTGCYYILISGDISGTETLSVIPSEEITLSQPGKSNITALIDQYESDSMMVRKSEWTSAELAEGAEAYGDIYLANETPITAGNWSGSMSFTVKLNSNVVQPETPPKPVRTPEQVWDASVNGNKSVVASLYNTDGHYSLEITGSGKMAGYSVQMLPPWRNSQYISRIESIVIGDGVTEIGTRAFQGCTSVTSVTLSDTVRVVDGAAFSGLTSLQSIVIPKGVTTIEAYAFNGMSSLKSVSVLTTGLTKVGNGAFANMASGSTIYVPNSSVKSLFVADTNYTSNRTAVSVGTTFAS